MTRNVPLRLIILQCSQNFLIEVLTFIFSISHGQVNTECYPVAGNLLVPVNDPAATQIVRRQLDRHLVTG